VAPGRQGIGEAIWEKLKQPFRERVSPSWAFATGLACLALGLLLGYVVWRPSADRQFPVEATPVSQPSWKGQRWIQIHQLWYDPNRDLYTIDLEVLGTVRLEGRLDNPTIRSVLAQALAPEQRPNLKLRVLRSLYQKVEGERVIKSLDPEILWALRQVVEKDPNPGMRLKAIRALATQVEDADVRATLIRALLKDKNVAVRMEALAALSQRTDASLAPIFKQAAEEDSSTSVRFLARQLIERRKEPFE